MGIGDGGLAIGPNPQSQIPNPQNTEINSNSLYNIIKQTIKKEINISI